MATPLTRQDMMAITDGAKNRIMERMVTKYDIQRTVDTARDRLLNTVNAFHVENQTLIRQSNSQNDQMWRRLAALEAQVGSLRQEVRVLTQTVNRLYEIQAEQFNRNRLQAPEPTDFNASNNYS